MDFQTAVQTCFQKYATFSGRAQRSEFWWYVLAIIIANLVLGLVDSMLFGGHGNIGVLGGLFSLATFVPSLAVSVRRLHDIGYSGWWLLLMLIPLLGFVVLLFFYIRDSEPGDNMFGPNPKRM
ncbi:MAG: DUF805 domain-containing protein [Rhodobacter sp.]|mgnify:CR=1 FL=1|uniref:DUF805 domain-containing protein n=1 Tax=Pararhodobacter sp. TaxID=2127056 RepID=UPI001DFAA392|nr:DUF805 domain-containing protein [Pararhodobacter sp.]MCB1343985.1 DUF805 domain-containing protein [Paracoccaceae bacterium]MCC0071758.1 DUF805 domain-containing protein [Rhodobacter sp.]HPD93973.1 DUF805 domain-containing protein [Pararhodobacter sp.]